MKAKLTERKAIRFVLKYLKKIGDPGKEVKSCGYDIKTKRRKIEVKSRGRRRARNIQINEHNIRAFLNRKNKNIELWVVTGVNSGTPELIRFSKKKLLLRKNQIRLWTLTLTNPDFDKVTQL